MDQFSANYIWYIYIYNITCMSPDISKWFLNCSLKHTGRKYISHGWYTNYKHILSLLVNQPYTNVRLYPLNPLYCSDLTISSACHPYPYLHFIPKWYYVYEAIICIIIHNMITYVTHSKLLHAVCMALCPDRFHQYASRLRHRYQLTDPREYEWVDP